MIELSMTVVGIDYPNADKSNRRMELLYSKPGDRVELRLEPKNKHDRNAVAVFSERGIQVGYLTAERAPYIGGRIRNGEPFEAILQDLDTLAAYVRVRFGGGQPSLPAHRADHDPGDDANGNGSGFYPDEESSDWGA